MKIIQELDTDFGTTPWAYDIVLQKRSLNQGFFRIKTFPVHHLTSESAQIVSYRRIVLCINGLRCVGTIDLVSRKDLNSFHAKLEALYQQSLINDPTSKDNPERKSKSWVRRIILKGTFTCFNHQN
jgi:hypothetical protein